MLSTGKEEDEEEEVAGTEAVANTLEGMNKCYVLLCVAFACASSIILGYDIGVMAGAIVYIEPTLDLSEMEVQMVMASINIVAAISALFAGPLADRFGRKAVVGASNAVDLVGCALVTAAPNFGVMLIGRILVGVSVGFGFLACPLLAVEIVPSGVRGKLVSCIEVFINCGILLGYVSNFAFLWLPEQYSWRVMIGLGVLPPLIILIWMIWMPESPRWLLSMGKEHEGRVVLRRLYGVGVDGDGNDAAVVERRVKEIKGSINSDMEEASWREMFCQTELTPPIARRMILLALIVMSWQQLSGNESAVYYTPTILKDAGVKSDTWVMVATMGVGVFKTVFIVVGLLLFDKIGRRPMLLLSGLGMATSLFLLSCSFEFDLIWLAVSALCSFMASFSIGFGPLSFTYGSEIVPQRYRAKSFGIGTFLNRMFSGIVALTFLSFSSAIGTAGVFLFYCVVMMIGVVMVFLFIPETKGVSLERMASHVQAAGVFQVPIACLGS